MSGGRRFADKVALVTGGASGIGAATARAFAREGAMVAIADRDGDGAARTAAEIAAEGGAAIGLAVDVSDAAACAAMVAEVEARCGRLDVAFNNAGIPSPVAAPIDAVEIGDWRRVMAINVDAVFYCIKAEVPALKRAGGGVIVNAASSASFIAAPQMPAYIASKHAVAGITKAAAIDLIGHGIRVNAICPGMTATPMMLPLMDDPAMRAGLEAMMPIGRMARPEDMADGVLFLASAEAAYAVGTLLRIDGGLTIA